MGFDRNGPSEELLLRRAYGRGHYAANREWLVAGARRYRAENREAINARQRARRAANPENYRAQDRQWRRANPEKVAAMHARWNAANPEKVREYQRRSKAKCRPWLTEKCEARDREYKRRWRAQKKVRERAQAPAAYRTDGDGHLAESLCAEVSQPRSGTGDALRACAPATVN